VNGQPDHADCYFKDIDGVVPDQFELVSNLAGPIPPNEPPVANDDSAATPENTAVTIDVATNDTDPDGDLDPASANTTCVPTCVGPADGSLINKGDGTFTYSPDPNFNGPDSFVYEICDSGSPSLCDTATVSIAVAKTFRVWLPIVRQREERGSAIYLPSGIEFDVRERSCGARPLFTLDCGEWRDGTLSYQPAERQ
jgi:hypothetical protein